MLISVGLVFSMLTSSQAETCQNAQLRAMLDAATNLEADRALSLLEGILDDNPDYPLGPFYRALIGWSEGQLETAAAVRQPAMQQAIVAVEELERRWQREPAGTAKQVLRFSLGVALGFAARMSLFDGAYLRAYRLGKSARAHIEAVVEAEPDHPDAALWLGLFEIYTAAMPDDFSWLGKMIDWEGDVDKGVAWLEQAITQSPQFAHEAARALLVEVPVRYPSFCANQQLAERIGQKSGNNPYYSLGLQFGYLRCGAAEKAAVLHQMRKISSSADPDIRLAHLKAGLRVDAQLGRSEEILRRGQEGLPKDQAYAYHFALANAYDVSGERDEAKVVYARLAQDAAIDSHLRHLAGVRLVQPYVVPQAVTLDRHWRVAKACPEG